MITIRRSIIDDFDSYDTSTVTKSQLYMATMHHRSDVKNGLTFFKYMLERIMLEHDMDKISDFDSFHNGFITRFEDRKWIDKHTANNKHHALSHECTPEDINLIDLLEIIVDCTVAGMSRRGDVYPIIISEKMLVKAFNNTFNLLKDQIELK